MYITTRIVVDHRNDGKKKYIAALSEPSNDYHLLVASHEEPEGLAEVDEARDEAFVGNHRAHVLVSSL